MTFATWLRSMFRAKQRQTCFVYCPGCKVDLVASALECEDTDLVRYLCKCGTRSTWDFDSYPVPFRVQETR